MFFKSVLHFHKYREVLCSFLVFKIYKSCKRFKSYLANFQLQEANFQFMTILPLKQRWRKMLRQRTVWDCLQPNCKPRIARPTPHPPLQHKKQKENQPTGQGSAPLLLHFPLPYAPTSTKHQSMEANATCSSHSPMPLHAVTHVEMLALLMSFLLDPAQRLSVLQT